MLKTMEKLVYRHIRDEIFGFLPPTCILICLATWEAAFVAFLDIERCFYSSSFDIVIGSQTAWT
jgi:hypothetical protein